MEQIFNTLQEEACRDVRLSWQPVVSYPVPISILTSIQAEIGMWTEYKGRQLQDSPVGQVHQANPLLLVVQLLLLLLLPPVALGDQLFPRVQKSN